MDPMAWPKPFSKRISCRGMAANATLALEEAGRKRRFFRQNKQFKPHNSWICGHSQCFLVKSQGWSRLVIFLSFLVQSPPFSSQRHVRWLDSFCWHNPNTFPPVISQNYGKSPFIMKCPMKNGGSFHSYVTNYQRVHPPCFYMFLPM